MVAEALERYRTARQQAWQWSRELAWIKKLALAFGLACLIGILAQVRIPLTPVPITGQTFGVLLAAVLLGQGWAGVSLAIYVGLGAAGVPWFNGLTGGIQAIAGPTGGYLVGMILAAIFLGYVTDRFAKTRNIFWVIGLMLLADFVLVFGPGLIQLDLWLHLVKHNGVSFGQLLGIGLVPFIAGDVVKVLAAAILGWALMPKQDTEKKYLK